MSQEILITGGTGKTGSRLVEALKVRGMAPRLASRSPQGEGTVRFDWSDSSTFENAAREVSAVYLLAPTNAAEPLDAMRPFLDYVLQAGVTRFILLSASLLEAGGPMMGQVHAYLRQHAPEWGVLRPSWFMQNSSEQQHLATLRDENVIYSATQDGRVPFIDAADIAAVATEMLLSPQAPNRDAVLTGPQALSYDEVAHILSDVTGRTISHQHLSEAELAARYNAIGMPPIYAQTLAAMDTAIAQGAEDRVTSEVRDFTGREANDFETFAQTVREVWTLPGA